MSNKITKFVIMIRVLKLNKSKLDDENRFYKQLRMFLKRENITDKNKVTFQLGTIDDDFINNKVRLKITII